MLKKIIIILVLLLAVWFFVVPKIPFLNTITKVSDIDFGNPLSQVPKGKPVMVEEKLVIGALTRVKEIVGTTGPIEKTFEFSQKRFSTRFGFINSMGERKCIMVIRGTFKMGFDMSFINSNTVFIKGTTVEILTPDPIIISLELPFDKIDITSSAGILTEDLTDADKQKIYEDGAKKIRLGIENDESIKAQAIQDTRNNIRDILMLIPDVKEVQFVDLQ